MVPFKLNILGYVAWIGDYSQEDSVLVQILYDLGAVPFVRTNVPQTLMVSAYIVLIHQLNSARHQVGGNV